MLYRQIMIIHDIKGIIRTASTDTERKERKEIPQTIWMRGTDFLGALTPDILASKNLHKTEFSTLFQGVNTPNFRATPSVFLC